MHTTTSLASHSSSAVNHLSATEYSPLPHAGLCLCCSLSQEHHSLVSLHYIRFIAQLGYQAWPAGTAPWKKSLLLTTRSQGNLTEEVTGIALEVKAQGYGSLELVQGQKRDKRYRWGTGNRVWGWIKEDLDSWAFCAIGIEDFGNAIKSLWYGPNVGT